MKPTFGVLGSKSLLEAVLRSKPKRATKDRQKPFAVYTLDCCPGLFGDLCKVCLEPKAEPNILRHGQKRTAE